MENTIQSDLIRGHINTIILKALSDGDRYGYDIVREIEQKSSGQYKLKQPTLYSCLKRLEIQGFIRSYWGAKSNGGRRKYFTLTDMGRELFLKNQSEWEYSRTVIDKLISDKEVNLAELSVPNDSDNDDERFDDKEFADEEPESEADGTYASESETVENYTDSESSEQEVASSAESTAETDSGVEEIHAEKEPQQDIVFSDTTAIMNELFRRQVEAMNDASYTDKLISEKYVSDRTQNAFTSTDYFKDFLDDTESADRSAESEISTKADSPAYDTPPAPPVPPVYENPAYVEPPVEENVGHADEPPVQESLPESKPTDMFLDYHTSTVVTNSESAIIEREYRNILGDFLNPSFIERTPRRTESTPPPPVAEEPTRDESHESKITEESQETADELPENLETYTNDVDVNRKLNKLTGEVREMGDNVVIRTHNTASSKEYSNTYYYYSNKLMIVHYGILFGIMMLEILFTAVFVNPIMHAGRSSDKWFYIIAAVVAVAFPIVAFVKNFTAPDKRKRINFSLKNSLIYRLIVMAQCFLIIYCINIIAGMPLSFGKEYLATVLLPALLCTGFPVSALIFNALFKSKKFAVEH